MAHLLPSAPQKNKAQLREFTIGGCDVGRSTGGDRSAAGEITHGDAGVVAAGQELCDAALQGITVVSIRAGQLIPSESLGTTSSCDGFERVC